MQADVQGIRDRKADEPRRERDRLCCQRFAGQHEEQTCLHRIAHVAIRAGDDELASRIPRSERAGAEPYEKPDAVNDERGTGRRESRSRECRRDGRVGPLVRRREEQQQSSRDRDGRARVAAKPSAMRPAITCGSWS